MRVYFFFNDTATTEIYTLSLHDALPICETAGEWPTPRAPFGLSPLSVQVATQVVEIATPRRAPRVRLKEPDRCPTTVRSEEHTSELQSRQYLVCRLLLEKKK